jgi:hypothetical protein
MGVPRVTSKSLDNVMLSRSAAEAKHLACAEARSFTHCARTDWRSWHNATIMWGSPQWIDQAWVFLYNGPNCHHKPQPAARLANIGAKGRPIAPTLPTKPSDTLGIRHKGRGVLRRPPLSLESLPAGLVLRRGLPPGI